MKKFILSLTALFTVGTMAAFANTPVSVDPKAAANFKKEFSSAELVQWSQEGSTTKSLLCWVEIAPLLISDRMAN